MDLRAQGEILNQALPYIQQFHGQTFVIKYGGSAMRDPAALNGVIRNVLLLQLVGIRPVLVHGGGPEIDRWIERMGGKKVVLNGLRVTDDDTMEIVEMALAGRANKSLVAEVHRAGGKAIGLSGRDGALLVGETISEELGRAGRIIQVNTEVVQLATNAGFIPVVCSVAADTEGGPLNVNADTAAAALAGALGAAKLVLLTDTDGVYGTAGDRNTLLGRITPTDVERLIATGKADGGMVPKLEAGLRALDDGVDGVHLINGGIPNALLLEVFTDHGIGTMIVRS